MTQIYEINLISKTVKLAGGWSHIYFKNLLYRMPFFFSPSNASTEYSIHLCYISNTKVEEDFISFNPLRESYLFTFWVMPDYGIINYESRSSILLLFTFWRDFECGTYKIEQRESHLKNYIYLGWN